MLKSFWNQTGPSLLSLCVMTLYTLAGCSDLPQVENTSSNPSKKSQNSKEKKTKPEYRPSVLINAQKAIEDGNLSDFKMSLNQGTSLNFEDPEGRTFMQLAAEAGNLQIFNFLAERKAPADSNNPFYPTLPGKILSAYRSRIREHRKQISLNPNAPLRVGVLAENKKAKLSPTERLLLDQDFFHRMLRAGSQIDALFEDENLLSLALNVDIYLAHQGLPSGFTKSLAEHGLKMELLLKQPTLFAQQNQRTRGTGVLEKIVYDLTPNTLTTKHLTSLKTSFFELWNAVVKIGAPADFKNSESLISTLITRLPPDFFLEFLQHVEIPQNSFVKNQNATRTRSPLSDYALMQRNRSVSATVHETQRLGSLVLTNLENFFLLLLSRPSGQEELNLLREKNLSLALSNMALSGVYSERLVNLLWILGAEAGNKKSSSTEIELLAEQQIGSFSRYPVLAFFSNNAHKDTTATEVLTHLKQHINLYQHTLIELKPLLSR